jgi:hypothetical protein
MSIDRDVDMIRNAASAVDAAQWRIDAVAQVPLDSLSGSAEIVAFVVLRKDYMEPEDIDIAISADNRRSLL